jgi:hypothetical protein
MTTSVKELVQNFIDLWWESDIRLPEIGTVYSLSEQAENENQLGQLIRHVNKELVNPPTSRAEALALQGRLGVDLNGFAKNTFGITDEQLRVLPSSTFSTAAEDFVRKARSFDPDLSSDDIYQAGRNAWTANGLQWLLGLPVRNTPSIFAYSLLYPYTDNYLDDRTISSATKLAFNKHFRLRLEGKSISPLNDHEKIIFGLVGMIEKEFERNSYPDVYESLLAIHIGQAKSLGLMRPKAAPGEVDVLGISFEKGGTSVMTDSYLAAGQITAPQREYSFGHGVLAQLLDDLEDVQDDLREGRLTVFSQAAGHWSLDALTNRTINFGQKVFQGLACFEVPESAKGLIRRFSTSMLIDTASQSERFYTKSYLNELERYSPFRFSYLRKQRKEFARRNGSVVRLIETLLPKNLWDDETTNSSNSDALLFSL